MRHIRVQAALWPASLQAAVFACVVVYYPSNARRCGPRRLPHRLRPGRAGSPGPKALAVPAIVLAVVSGVRVSMLAVIEPAVVHLVLLAVFVVILEGAERAADVRQDRLSRAVEKRAEPRAVRCREPLRCVDVQGDVVRRAAELEAPLVLQLRLQRGGKCERLPVDRSFDQNGNA